MNERPSLRLRRPTRPALLAAILFGHFAACDGGPPTSGELEEIASRSSEVASMLRDAAAGPATRVDGGYAVTSLATAQEPGGWIAASKQVAVHVDSSDGSLTVTSARGARVVARRVGPVTSQVRLDGPALLFRDASGSAHAALFARPAGVEDLLFESVRRDQTGYDLDLPAGWSMRQPRGFRGLIEIRDSRGKPRMRIAANAAWDANGARVPVDARLDGRRVLFSVPPEAPLPVTIDPEWQDTGSPAQVRARSTATMLQDGTLLVIGGTSGSDEVLADTAEVLCTTEIYDPLDLTWEAGPTLQAPGDTACTPLMDHSAVPLPDGSVLVTGGANRDSLIGADQPAALDRAWRYWPGRRAFEATGPMVEARVHHTGTLLGSGKVLLTGGSDRQTPLGEASFECPKVGDSLCQRCVGKASAEIYDPIAGTFTRIDMPTPRSCHTATLLEGDEVLLIGGGGQAVEMNPNAETGAPLGGLSLFRDGEFVELPTRLISPRLGHVAVHRPDVGQILVAFGRDAVSLVAPPKKDAVAGEILDVEALLSDAPPATARAVPCGPPDEGSGGGPGSGGAGSGGSPGSGGGGADATGGAGGADASGGAGGDASGGGGAGPSGSGGGGGGPEAAPCPIGRAYASAVITRSGQALVAGGHVGTALTPTSTVDVFDFELGEFVSPAPPQLLSPVSKPVLSLLPTGKILLVGLTAPAELLDDTSVRFSREPPPRMHRARAWHTATPLPDGTLLLAGGAAGDAEGANSLDTAEIFDPSSMSSTPIPALMRSRRTGHTATLLSATAEHGERVLLIGGMTEWLQVDAADAGATESAEIYDPVTRTFTATGAMSRRRALHTATRLPTGHVLVTGGVGDGLEAQPPSAELYDPATGQFTELPAPAAQRLVHTASLLPSGDVLIAGGFAQQGNAPSPSGELSSAEIFDLETLTFRSIPSMIAPRGFHKASPLPDGSILITGGSAISRIGEIFDPETETFRPTQGLMAAARYSPAALVLPSGKILVAGGSPELQLAPASDAEVYDPASEQFETVVAPGDLEQRRWDFPALLLADGRVALFGGNVDQFSAITTDAISLLDLGGSAVGSGAQLVSGPPAATPGGVYDVTGLSLTSFWETSSGPYASPTGSPISVWVPVSGSPVLGTFAPWSSGDSSWSPPSSPYAGPGLLFAARHGQTSAGLSVSLSRAPNGVPCSADAACESGFCSDGVCCNERCHVAGDADAACRSCSVEMGAAEDGVCSFVEEDQDPHEDCTQAVQCAPKFAVCGGDGACKECFCTSKLDCSDGYVCTERGTCERPAEPKPDESCSMGAGRGGAGAPWGTTVLGLAALAALASRRRGRPSGGRAHMAAAEAQPLTSRAVGASFRAYAVAYRATGCARESARRTPRPGDQA